MNANFVPQNPPGRGIGNPAGCFFVILGSLLAGVVLGFILVGLFATKVIYGVEVCSVTRDDGGRGDYAIQTSEGAFRLFVGLNQDALASQFEPGAIVNVQLAYWNVNPISFDPSVLAVAPAATQRSSCPVPI